MNFRSRNFARRTAAAEYPEDLRGNERRRRRWRQPVVVAPSDDKHAENSLRIFRFARIYNVTDARRDPIPRFATSCVRNFESRLRPRLRRSVHFAVACVCPYNPSPREIERISDISRRALGRRERGIDSRRDNINVDRRRALLLTPPILRMSNMYLDADLFARTNDLFGGSQAPLTGLYGFNPAIWRGLSQATPDTTSKRGRAIELAGARL